MNNLIITSTQNSKIKYLKSIMNDIKSDYFIAEGYHLVEEALKHNLVEEIYELNSSNIYENAFKISENVLKAITFTKQPEGVVALCKKPNNNEIIGDVLFLDDVQDPGNIGTIIRTAQAFNFKTVVLNSNPYNDKVIRSSQGAIFNINIIQYKNKLTTLQNIKDLNYELIATSLENDSKTLKELNITNKMCVIVGNEGRGIDKSVYPLANQKIYIPINFESLNIGVATGIILNRIYELKEV